MSNRQRRTSAQPRNVTPDPQPARSSGGRASRASAPTPPVPAAAPVERTARKRGGGSASAAKPPRKKQRANSGGGTARPALAVAAPELSPSNTSQRSFDLQDFIERDNEATQPHETPNTNLPALLAEMASLRAQVDQLTKSQGAEPPRAASTIIASPPVQLNPPHARPASTSLPPPEIHQLAASHFSTMTAAPKEKNGYYPSPTDQLAAHRIFRDLHMPSGKSHTSRSFVLAFVENNQVRVRLNSILLMALYEARLGRLGASILLFEKLEESEYLYACSDNSRLVVSFNPSTADKSTQKLAPCYSYERLVRCIDGLSDFSSEFWFPWCHARLCAFVIHNESSDKTNDPERVRLTAGFVDKFLGDALCSLRHDGPSWWEAFQSTLAAIHPRNQEWLSTIVAHAANRAHIPLPPQPPNRSANRVYPNQPTPPRKNNSGNPKFSIPDHIYSLTPKKGKLQPCLHAVIGGRCSFGTSSCHNGRRLHVWPRADAPIPDEVISWWHSTHPQSKSA